jgi:hypothetical protein
VLLKGLGQFEEAEPPLYETCAQGEDRQAQGITPWHSGGDDGLTLRPAAVSMRLRGTVPAGAETQQMTLDHPRSRAVSLGAGGGRAKAEAETESVQLV